MNYLVIGLYIISFALFIYGLMGLTGPKTAVRGNLIAAVGMAIAVAATLVKIRHTDQWVLIIAGLVVGVVLGVPPARYTKMTAMPQLVAFFNGVGGGTVALIALSEFIETQGFSAFQHGESPTVHIVVASLFAAVIGSISFWGSIIAFGKLQEIISGAPIGFGRAQQPVNLLLLVAAVAAAVVVGVARPSRHRRGVPVVDDRAAGRGRRAGPDGGAAHRRRRHAGRHLAAQRDDGVVCRGRRSGAEQHRDDRGRHDRRRVRLDPDQPDGQGHEPLDPRDRRRRLRRRRGGPSGDGGGDKTVKATSAADAAIQMAYANQVIVVPGYGLAVAQAQHAVKDMAALLEDKGVEVKYAIHPVAGRMPGHMNVLLAEAEVDYDAMKDMDDINDEFARTDVAIVIGANDVTNPAARNDASSPIYGMPILNVDKAKSVIVLKRSMNSGFAGIDNPLFYGEGTSMLFGDAKKSVTEVAEELKAL
ncbi:NAD(P) transhydrogenase beta subunit [Mycobacterium intracellulare 1956]|uniref:NAD(P) transhydrogenase subunit beta n=1 Tax=Mycobacterium intracellulare 1956 TaxID=1299331 RepID=X8CDE6_MYCIT|nr:NAD(P) transhydrogenase beta subunit [Mycobacterium intracellulare 1956]